MLLAKFAKKLDAHDKSVFYSSCRAWLFSLWSSLVWTFWWNYENRPL